MITKKILFVTLILAFVCQTFAQKLTISGYVTDTNTGETIIGVNIIVKGTNKGAASDGNGYFVISGLAPGKYTLMFSHIAYEEKKINLFLENKSLVLKDTPIKPKAVQVDEIVVLGEKSDVADPEIEISHLELSPRAIKTIPSGYSDVFRALKYLPGVEGIDPISPLYSARGGDPSENLVLLDGVTIYNPYHYVTASSLFNLYAVKNIELLVGGFGAEYGGRNSSVLYITTKEGNNKKLHGEIEPTTSHTRAVFDFPVGKNATMMVSTRAYYDLVSRFLFSSPSYFYDMNFSLNWKINQQNRLSLRYFFSKDLFDYDFDRISSYFATTFDTDIFDDYHLNYFNKWYNQAATAILKTIISPSIFLQSQLSGSFFSSDNLSKIEFEYEDDESKNKIKLDYKTEIQNKIQDISGKSTLNIRLNSSNTFKLGGEFNYYAFSNNLEINDFGEGKTDRKPDLIAGFVENKTTLGPISVRPGIRLSKFSYQNKWYREPRFNSVIKMPYNFKIKAAWGKYYQYIISMNSQEYEISQFLDNYYPLKSNKPSASTHYILGIEKSISWNSRFSVDFYYKDISRTYCFDTNLSESEILSFSEKLREGSGKAYGMEVMWQGTWNRFSGWVSYGLSRAERSYPHIMNGKRYLFDYDRTHSFKAVINHQIHPALSYSGTLRILSGVPKTLERSIKSYYYYDPFLNEIATYPTYRSDMKNNARFPLYIRLDLGLKKKIRSGFGAELAEFLGADEAFLNVRFGNLLFFLRNVWFYIPMGEGDYYGLGSNYIPEFSMGYTIKF